MRDCLMQAAAVLVVQQNVFHTQNRLCQEGCVTRQELVKHLLQSLSTEDVQIAIPIHFFNSG